MLNNAFDYIKDFAKAQQLANEWDMEKLFKKLQWLAGIYCSVHKKIDEKHHWSIMQQEYATDIVFKKQADLKPIYKDLIAKAIHTVKPANIATFLGQKLNGNYQGEVGNNYNIRIEGSRIKHSMGLVSIKMYDKFNKILRIETTVNDVSFFKHYPTVEHRDGTTSQKIADVKKNIFSLPTLIGILQAANKRYLEFISAIEDNGVGKKKLFKVTSSAQSKDKNYNGFNFFDKTDQDILLHLASGEFNIPSFRAKDFKKRFKQFSDYKISGVLKKTLGKRLN